MGFSLFGVWAGSKGYLQDSWAKVTCDTPRMAIMITPPVFVALQMVMTSSFAVRG
jgi:hypothetical protein